METQEALVKFRDLGLSKDRLLSIIGKDLHKVIVDRPIEITALHVINLLKEYQIGQISLQQLLDWVNLVWFTELYEYSDKHSDSIASVLNELEEADEDENKLSSSNIQRYIQALKSNVELL